MADLISMETVKQAFIQYKNDAKVLTPFELNRFVDLFAIIMDLPTVDAVPVVRCKDCKYSVEAKNAKGEYRALCGNGQSICCSSHWTLPEDWYCADGERNENA